ncbi:hypothetical protein DFR70_105423 [Nocardia tenerifensis]|uniref:Uncharacterized protein n=1 Tax=Nocardia tenerifensis TaxID=228006 RepID=A0A318K1V1_9NOCA|nr:hypothetical protein DFR70_105423 [Nocardia tenerifensis]
MVDVDESGSVVMESASSALPRSTLFDVGSLEGIMRVIGEGGQW